MITQELMLKHGQSVTRDGLEGEGRADSTLQHVLGAHRALVEKSAVFHHRWPRVPRS